MLGLVLVLTVLSGAMLFLWSRSGRPVEPDLQLPVERLTVEGGDDLPCPWCGAPTSERDHRCPGCHRQFGQPISWERV